MYISSELDRAFESFVKNKEKRHRMMEKAKVKDKEQEALNLGDGNRNELEVSFDSSAGSEAPIASTDDEDSADDESLRHSRPTKAKVRFLTFA